MDELKRVWNTTIISYACAFAFFFLMSIIPNLEISSTLIAAAVIAGMVFLATQKLKIFIKRYEILTVEDLEKINTKIVWTLMIGEYLLAVSFAILVLSE